MLADKYEQHVARIEREQRDRRDRFAAAALTGLLTDRLFNSESLDTRVATKAAQYADALIAELDKEK